jgi:hypothetical protein
LTAAEKISLARAAMTDFVSGGFVPVLLDAALSGCNQETCI